MYKRRQMNAFITVDTMYINIKYPHPDLFRLWFRHVDGIDHRKLKEGVAVGNFVIRTGAAGYKISVWNHDARAFLTEDVDDKRGEGNGMGIWVQLGPKFMIQHINEIQKAVNEFLFSIGLRGDYPARITRLDMAIDLLGVSMMEQDINLWIDGWVGRSKVSGVFYNSRTGNLETFYVGSRKSPIFLRVYDKVAQSIMEGDINYWVDIWKEYKGPVTRIEWEVKPNDGKFQEDLKDLSKFSGFSTRELLIYLLDWGRLCIPNPLDSNRRRWEDTEFWINLRKYVTIWADGIDWPISRYGKEFHGISEPYIKLVSGTLSGAMARLDEKNPTLMGLIEGLEKHGQTLEAINQKAAAKAEIYSKL
jgi:hypothetical protein